MWALLTERKVGRFPMPLHDRIPNFVGAEAAARRLTELPEWRAARRIKCNPDAPQRAVRLAALRDGKTVVMAVPRLRAERCFLRLDPDDLAGKLAAYALQDRGLDTVDAQVELGLPVDAREYVAAAGILADLGVDGVRLLTNNPAKVAGLRTHGVEVVAVERLRTTPLPSNAAYLRTKRDRMGHDLVLDPSETGSTA